jgi:hypothetical protein
VEERVRARRVPHVGLYEGTKHSTATELLRRGINEHVIQALLGHADVRSTRRCARLADQALVEALIPACGSDEKAPRNYSKSHHFWWAARDSNPERSRADHLRPAATEIPQRTALQL